MNKPLIAALIAAAATVALGPVAHAATDVQRAAAKQKFESMTPEEKAAAKEKMKAKWDAMTPEQQAEAKKHFAARHPGAAARMAEKQTETQAPAAPK